MVDADGTLLAAQGEKAPTKVEAVLNKGCYATTGDWDEATYLRGAVQIPQHLGQAGREAFLYDGINRLAPHWPRDVRRNDARGRVAKRSKSAAR